MHRNNYILYVLHKNDYLRNLCKTRHSEFSAGKRRMTNDKKVGLAEVSLSVFMLSENDQLHKTVWATKLPTLPCFIFLTCLDKQKKHFIDLSPQR